jgi:putative endonuclease
MTPQYRVYVLQNPAKRFYIGVSADVEHRLAEHNAGRSIWTKRKGPWELVWVSESQSLGAARKLENTLKRQKGGAGFYKMTGLSRS